MFLFGNCLLHRVVCIFYAPLSPTFGPKSPNTIVLIPKSERTSSTIKFCHIYSESITRMLIIILDISYSQFFYFSFLSDKNYFSSILFENTLVNFSHLHRLLSDFQWASVSLHKSA